ncbi:hypothetical protein B0T17DRAFT_614224 [Bombardia bombarda]|uniref:Uncharacterized protein n=1 Tax=Bombardia bombarda TaxID=252184 RepID=A0AA40C8N3_9PEZI|nr:hypothetical protein B0T17DRAFT_614224 [Bombardia bombarda]
MEQNQVESVEKRLYQDRGASFRGTAQIRFVHLHFGSLCPREPNKKVKEHLKEKFSNEGCLRLEPKNHIPAIISQETLEAAIRASPNVSQDSLLENRSEKPPELRFPDSVTIECLQGLHRIAAGKELLPRRDWWWTVDLYLDDASTELKVALSEEYSNSVNFSDGEIFLKLRQYDDDSNKHIGTIFAEKRMWGRLSKDKRKDLKQILRNKMITAGFDALRILPALFVGFRIEHRFMAMKCFEEISKYLTHILDVWTQILGGIKRLMRLVDCHTVELLQLRAPGYSSHDFSIVAKHFQEGKLFPAIQNQSDRKRIWENLRTILHLIPSLYSLFEDVKYLKGPARIVRQLCPSSRFSTREAMWRIFTGHSLPNNEYPIQVWETDYQSFLGSTSDQFEFGYRQVYLYAWRHWTELVPECPKKEDGEDTPMPQRPDPRTWCGIAKLAAKVGFESDEIDRLIASDPDREIAREALLKARSPEYFEYGESAFEGYLTQLTHIFNLAMEKPRADSAPVMLVPGCGESLERRCGRVFDNAYKNDRKHLFLGHLYSQNFGNGSGVSSFAVRASVYFAFFGRHLPNNGMQTISATKPTNPPPSRATENGTPNGPEAMQQPHGRDQAPQGAARLQATVPAPAGGQETPSTEIGNPGFNIPIVASRDGSSADALTPLPAEATDMEMTDYVSADPSKIVVKLWKDGKLSNYAQLIPMDKAAAQNVDAPGEGT